MIEELRDKERVYTGGDRKYPSVLNLRDIKEAPKVFQPRGERGVDERHVSTLAKALGSGGDYSKKRLDPVLVMWIGNEIYIVDGHHRLYAYQEERVKTEIPVEFFKGSLDEAILESGRRNKKDKLPMTNRQKQDFAWRLVKIGVYSKAQEAAASGVSDGQIGTMRKARKALGEKAQEYSSWWMAMRAYQGIAEQVEFNVDEWLNNEGQAIANKMSKMFGNRLSDNTELAAKAFEIYFGRKLEPLTKDLKAYLPAGEDGEEPDF